jgi:hypothetical protein
MEAARQGGELMTTTSLSSARKAVLRVGNGRGFVVQGADEQDRFVITAAHCLPFIPLAHPMADISERTYDSLLGRLSKEPSTAGISKWVCGAARLVLC